MIYVDAHNLIKRNYHGGGNPYSLFYNLLLKPGEKTVVCDSPTSRDYRRAIYSGYKAGRNSGEDPVYWEVYNNCITMAMLMPDIKVVSVTTGEADDYILCNASPGDAVYSNDKDMWPLVEPIRGVDIYIGNNTKVDENLIQTKFNAAAKHILLYKALVGDPSDKIPGKKGFGPAAWAKLDYKERSYLTHFFDHWLKNDQTDGFYFTESSRMSWILAKPYCEYESKVLTTDFNGSAIDFLTSKGIVL